MKVNCKQCSKEFDKTNKEIKKFPNHFCSRSCSAIFNNKLRGKTDKKEKILEGYKANKTVCANCQTIFQVSPSNVLKTNGIVCCSRLCRSEYNYKNFILKWLNGEELGHKGKNYDLKLRVKRYIEERDVSCVKCGQPNVWHGEPLVLHVDHIDGKCSNSRPENLRLLCPHCHSQTNTFGSKNKNSDRFFYNRSSSKKSLG